MPKVIIIPGSQIESVCQEVLTFANSCQTDFNFYLIPQSEINNSPLTKDSVEMYDALSYLENLKKKHGYENDDLILSFYNGTLKATSLNLTNLFCAGSRFDEIYPCTAVISLKYLGSNILEEKYNYEIQKHSILHLILCGIIGAYTSIAAHHDIGCLLDMNIGLRAFNLKLQKGYYLCSQNEFGCYSKIKKEKYGNSILRLCEIFKKSNYQKTINEIIMGDKIQVGNITNNSGQLVVGKDIKISNSTDDKKLLVEKIENLIKQVWEENISNIDKQALVTNFDKIKEEIKEEEKPDKAKIFKWLLNTKNILENLVLANHTRESIQWIYENFHFLVPHS